MCGVGCPWQATEKSQGQKSRKKEYLPNFFGGSVLYHVCGVDPPGHTWNKNQKTKTKTHMVDPLDTGEKSNFLFCVLFKICQVLASLPKGVPVIHGWLSKLNSGKEGSDPDNWRPRLCICIDGAFVCMSARSLSPFLMNLELNPEP